ncbi:armadillo-type protein, partial [Thamnocephalis sphaerospora]
VDATQASIVAKIAHQDWPEQWPDLMDVLVQLLREGTAEQAHGSLACLNEILQVDVVDQQIGVIAPVLSQELLRVVRADQTYPVATRVRAVKVIRACIDALYMIKDAHRDQVRSLVNDMLVEWLGTLQQLLTVQGLDEGVITLKLESIRTLSALVQSFSANIAGQFTAIVEAVWQDLERNRAVYVAESAKEDTLVTWTSQDEDGDATGLATLIMAELEFQSQCVRKKAAAGVYVRSGDASFLAQATAVLVAYMQIAQEQAEVWMEDAGRFIQDEDEDSLNASVRASAFDLLRNIMDRFEAETVQSLLVACDRYITESDAAKASGSGDWWRIEEACFAALGLAADVLSEELAKQATALRFAGKELLTELIPDRMQQKAYPFLQGRVLLLSGYFAQQYPASMAAQLVQAVVSLLSDGSAIPVRVSAMKALNSYCQHSDKNIVQPHREFVIADAVALVKVTRGETLQLVLETLLTFLNGNVESLGQMDIVCSTLLEAFTREPNDHISTSVIEDILDLAWQQPASALAAFTAAEPFLVQALHNAASHPEFAPFAIELLTQVAKASPSSFGAERLGQVFPLLLDTLMATHDHDLLQSGEQCLTQIVRWDCNFIAQWTDVSGRSGLERVLEYAAKLLDPQMSESAGATVGSLITCLVQKTGDRIQSSLPVLLNAVIVRLAASQTATQIQSLVMVFAELLRSQPAITIEFLCSTAVGNDTGMQVLLNKWCDNHTCFHGYFAIKLSIYALSLLLTNIDQRIMSVQLKGDLIISTDERIVTRSRSRSNPDQYTMVPAPVKILKLLLAEMPSSDAARNDGGDAASDDEDGDWEDLEEANLLGQEQLGFLSGMLQACDDVDDADDSADNPDIKNDPVYALDMKVACAVLLRARTRGHLTLSYHYSNTSRSSLSCWRTTIQPCSASWLAR